MAFHLRRQIRDAIVGALTGLASTGARVFKDRIYPLERSDLPGLLVNMTDERVEAKSLGVPRDLERHARLTVRAIAAGVANVDDTLDQMCAEIEIALAMPCTALAGLVYDCALQSCAFGFQPGEKPIGQATLTFDIHYRTPENAPDTAR
jgi:hypothetical protein